MKQVKLFWCEDSGSAEDRGRLEAQLNEWLDAQEQKAEEFQILDLSVTAINGEPSPRLLVTLVYDGKPRSPGFREDLWSAGRDS